MAELTFQIHAGIFAFVAILANGNVSIKVKSGYCWKRKVSLSERQGADSGTVSDPDSPLPWICEG